MDRAELMLTAGADLVGGSHLLQAVRFPRETGGDAVDLLNEILDIVPYDKGFLLKDREKPGAFMEGDGGLDRPPPGRQDGRTTGVDWVQHRQRRAAITVPPGGAAVLSAPQTSEAAQDAPDAAADVPEKRRSAV